MLFMWIKRIALPMGAGGLRLFCGKGKAEVGSRKSDLHSGSVQFAVASTLYVAYWTHPVIASLDRPLCCAFNVVPLNAIGPMECPA
jgi:hypothetical protein